MSRTISQQAFQHQTKNEPHGPQKSSAAECPGQDHSSVPDATTAERPNNRRHEPLGSWRGRHAHCPRRDNSTCFLSIFFSNRPTRQTEYPIGICDGKYRSCWLKLIAMKLFNLNSPTVVCYFQGQRTKCLFLKQQVGVASLETEQLNIRRNSWSEGDAKPERLFWNSELIVTRIKRDLLKNNSN